MEVYFNCDVITCVDEVGDKSNSNLAIVVDGGIIKDIGLKEKMFSLYKDEIEIEHDLHGRCIMPAFIDSHGHFLSVAFSLMQIDLHGIKEFKDVKKLVRVMASKYDYWVTAFSFEGHLTREEVDSIIENRPLLIMHFGGNIGFVNKEAREILGCKDKYYIEEWEFYRAFRKMPVDIDALVGRFRDTEKIYFSKGIVIAQEGYVSSEIMDLYNEIKLRTSCEIDLYGYGCYEDCVKGNWIIDRDNELKSNEMKSSEIKSNEMKSNEMKSSEMKGNEIIKIKGVKIILDGLPHNRTSYVVGGYLGDTNCTGNQYMSDEKLEEIFEYIITNKLQLIAHCTGDGAIEQLLRVASKYKSEVKKLRVVIIHGMLIKSSQFERIKGLGIIVSYFAPYIYYWGDENIRNLGLNTASTMCPIKQTMKSDIIVTIHQDSPVIMPNVFELLWCAVNRETRKGFALGQSQEATIYEAIKAVTINAAYQYGLENKVGSLERGKLANMIVLNKNPLKTAVDNIKNIEICTTIKDGITV